MGKKKILIVGAGPGGLTSAMILAHRGFDVTVFEKENTVGGRSAPIRLNGYTFDTGPTFLMMSFILKEMFAEAGKKLEDYLTLKRIEPLYRLKFKDYEVHPSGDPARMKAQIASLFPGNEGGYEKFIKKETRRFEKLFPCLQKSYSSPLDYLSSRFINAIPYFSIFSTMFEKLGDYFSADDLKLAFTFQAKYLGMSPWECPAAFTMVPLIEHKYGIYHVIGGLNAISLAMEKAAVEEGAVIQKAAKVKRILTRDRTAQGVELESGEVYTGDAVILNADFAYGVTRLFDDGIIRKYTRKKLDRMNFSCSIFMLYLGVDKVYDIPHHNIFFADDYRANVDAIFKGKNLCSDTSFYIQNASVIDPTLAPKGKSALYVLVPVANNRSGINWEKEKESWKNHILDLVEQRTELNDIRQHIEAEKVITPRDWEDSYNVFLGATFNLGHNLSQMLYRRPRNRFEELGNLYLTGGGTHPGSGLPTIYESARISANLICDSFGIPYTPPGPLPEKPLMD